MIIRDTGRIITNLAPTPNMQGGDDALPDGKTSLFLKLKDGIFIFGLAGTATLRWWYCDERIYTRIMKPNDLKMHSFPSVIIINNAPLYPLDLSGGFRLKPSIFAISKCGCSSSNRNFAG